MDSALQQAMDYFTKGDTPQQTPVDQPRSFNINDALATPPAPQKPPGMGISTQGDKLFRDGKETTLQGATSNAFRYPWKQLGYKNVDDVIANLDQVRQWGGNSINLYLDQDQLKTHMPDLDRVVDWATQNNLSVSLYPIAPKAADGYADTDNPKFRGFPASLAQRYKDKNNILYGLWAEPGGEMNDTWVPKAEEMAKAVRDVNPNAPLIMSGQYSSRDLDYLKTHPFPFDNTVYDFHDYPYSDAHTEVDTEWNKSKSDWMKGKYPVLQGEFGKYWGKDFSSPGDLDFVKQKIADAKSNKQSMFGYALDEPGGLGLLQNGQVSPKGQLFQQAFQQPNSQQSINGLLDESMGKFSQTQTGAVMGTQTGPTDSLQSAMDYFSQKDPLSEAMNYFSNDGTSTAIQHGADPADLAFAKAHLGKQEYQNYCQTFVEKASGGGWHGGSAVDAFNNQRQRALPSLLGSKPGDLVYFDKTPDNPYGHTGILSGADKFISATPHGVQELPIPDWQKMTGQKMLGVIPQQQNYGQ